MAASLRNVLAVLGGILSGAVVVGLIQAINSRLYPLPANFDLQNAGMVRQYTAALPVQAFLIVLLSYAVGFPLAVFITTRLAVTNPAQKGVITAAFFGAASVMNLMALPHPVWFWIVNFAVLLFAAWFGVRAGLTGHPVNPAPDTT